MRRLETRRDYRDDSVRIASGFYPLNGIDLEIREVLDIMHRNGIKDINEFIKCRDAYVQIYVREMEEKQNGIYTW